jgi:uncharacterized lipoprotein YmbA
MRALILAAALTLGACACTQEQETLAQLREQTDNAEAIEAAESALGNCQERVVQILAILAKVVVTALD